MTDTSIDSFQNLGILFIGKKEVPEILYKRKLTDFQSRYFNQSLTGKFTKKERVHCVQSNGEKSEHLLTEIQITEYAEKVRESLREQSEKEAKDMNLNSVKICFEAFVLQNEALYPICSPVYSRPIANQSKCDSLKNIRLVLQSLPFICVLTILNRITRLGRVEDHSHQQILRHCGR